jgi:hypothetical protein
MSEEGAGLGGLEEESRGRQLCFVLVVLAEARQDSFAAQIRQPSSTLDEKSAESKGWSIRLVKV